MENQLEKVSSDWRETSNRVSGLIDEFVDRNLVSKEGLHLHYSSKEDRLIMTLNIESVKPIKEDGAI